MPVNPDLYRAVVRLTNTFGLDKRKSLGSGVVFSPTGLVITNNHVIEDADFGTAYGQITVELLERIDRPASAALSAEVVIRNEAYDLAVVRIVGTPPAYFLNILKTPPVDASLMERRMRVLGYPPLGGGTITITRGIVSGFDDAGNLKTDAEINPGNSGGAALDDLDMFLGIPSFVVGDALGKLGFVIPGNRIKEWFGAILKSGVPETTERLATAFNGGNLNFSEDNLDQDNKYPRILSKFAAVETLLENGEHESAIPHLKFILEKRPRSGLAYHYLGDALLGLGRYLEAADQFRISLVYSPERVPTLGNLGVALMLIGRHGDALQVFEQIIDASDNPAELWPSYNNIGRIYELWGKADVARLYRERAAELAPAAKERLSQYRHQPKTRDAPTALLAAFVYAEIASEDAIKPQE